MHQFGPVVFNLSLVIPPKTQILDMMMMYWWFSDLCSLSVRRTESSTCQCLEKKMGCSFTFGQLVPQSNLNLDSTVKVSPSTSCGWENPDCLRCVTMCILLTLTRHTLFYTVVSPSCSWGSDCVFTAHMRMIGMMQAYWDIWESSVWSSVTDPSVRQKFSHAAASIISDTLDIFNPGVHCCVWCFQHYEAKSVFCSTQCTLDTCSFYHFENHFRERLCLWGMC